jgi:hypothetical protein
MTAPAVLYFVDGRGAVREARVTRVTAARIFVVADDLDREGDGTMFEAVVLRALRKMRARQTKRRARFECSVCRASLMESGSAWCVRRVLLMSADGADRVLGPQWRQRVPLPAIEASFRALGLDASATAEAVKHAFRRLALDAHPDRPGGSHGAFVALQAAFTCALAAIEGARGGGDELG